jgi:hypothetical protein
MDKPLRDFLTEAVLFGLIPPMTVIVVTCKAIKKTKAGVREVRCGTAHTLERVAGRIHP